MSLAIVSSPAPVNQMVSFHPAPLALSPQSTTELLSVMAASLTQMVRVDEVKDLRDKAQAIAAYTKQRGDSLEIQTAAAAIKLRAERRMGELLQEMPKQNGGDAARTRLQSATELPKPSAPAPPTLADMGIEKTLAHRCQKIASLPEELFEDYIDSAADGKHELTTAGAIKLAKSEDLRAVKESHAKLAKTETGTASVCAWEALPFLQSLPDGSADLLLTDPPYMTDVQQDIAAFAHEWLPVALAKVHRTGRAYVCIGAYPDELLAYLSAPRAHMKLSQVLGWTYRNTLGPSPSHDYKLNWQAVLYFVGPDAPPLDCPVMNEQFSIQDINAPDGRLANRFHEWQKPDELAERFIRHSTASGAVVLDPFAGTGTFLAAAARLGRQGIGCERDTAQITLCEKRGITSLGRDLSRAEAA